jgi:hypothetical protein
MAAGVEVRGAGLDQIGRKFYDDLLPDNDGGGLGARDDSCR